MSNVTQILDRVQRSDSKAAEELLPLIYDELRRLAAHRMACEAPGQTLQPTALVHEAWLGLAGANDSSWENRAHFFGAAAEAMRRILVENARRKRRVRHGGGLARVDLEGVELGNEDEAEKLLFVHDALQELAGENVLQAEVVKLRFFGGLQHDEIARTLGVSEKTVKRYWAHAKAWLSQKISAEQK